jgi:hypothetical protein
MKDSITLFLFLFVFSILLCSCSNDKEDKSKHLIKLVETLADGTSTTTLFAYNGDKITTIEGIGSRTDFNYTDGLITKIVTIDKATQGSKTLEYSYNTNQLIQVLSPNNYVIKYTHNSDDTVCYEKKSMLLGNQGVKIYHGTLYFKGKNLIKEDRVLDDAAPGVVSKYTVNFEYDLKKNPFYFVLGYSKIIDHGDLVSMNNKRSSVVQASSTNAAGQIISSAKSFNSIFKYDMDGYPTKQFTETAKLGYLKSEYFYL